MLFVSPVVLYVIRSPFCISRSIRFSPVECNHFFLFQLKSVRRIFGKVASCCSHSCIPLSSLPHQAIIPLQEDILDVQFLRPLLYLGRCERNHLEYCSSRFGSGSIFIDSHSCYYRLFLHSPCEGPSLQTIFHPFQGNRSWWNDPLANCLCDLSSS